MFAIRLPAILCFVSSLYFLVACVPFLALKDCLDFLPWYFLAALAAAAIASGYYLYLTWKKPSELGQTKQIKATPIYVLAIAGALLAAAVALRFYALTRFSLWLDEDLQARNIGVNSLKDLIDTAAAQQQPPLSYLLTYANLKFFGINDFAMRLEPAVSGSLSIILFFFLAYQLTQSTIAALAASLFLLLNPWLIWYSQEARPYSLGVFTGILYFWAASTLLLKNSRASFLLLFTCSTLFLLAIGLQPPVLILTTIITISCFAFHSKWKMRVWWAAYAQLFALFLFIPLQIQVAKHSTRVLKLAKTSLPHESLLKKLSEDLDLAFMLFSGQAVSLPICFGLIFLMAFAFYIFIHFKTRLKNFLALWLPLQILVLLYPVLLILIYHSVVNYPNHARYMITIIPLTLLLIAFSIKIIEDNRARFHALQKYLFLGFSIFFLFFYAAHLTHTLVTRVYLKKPVSQEWKSLYDYFRKEEIRSGVAYVTQFSNNWILCGFIGTNFYYDESIRRKIQLMSQFDCAKYRSPPESVYYQTDLMIQDIHNRLTPEYIYLVEPTDWSRTLNTYWRKNPSVGDAHLFTNIFVLKIKTKASLESTLMKLFTAMEQIDSESQYMNLIYDFLFQANNLRGDCAKAQLYLNRVQSAVGAQPDRALRVEKFRKDFARTCKASAS